MEAGARSRQETRSTRPTHPADDAFRDVAADRQRLGRVRRDPTWRIAGAAQPDLGHHGARRRRTTSSRAASSGPSLSTWGWIAIIIAAVQIIAGGLLFARKIGGVLMAIVLAMCGIFVNFLSIGAYPVWSIIAIVCSALVLWAVTVHGDDFDLSRADRGEATLGDRAARGLQRRRARDRDHAARARDQDRAVRLRRIRGARSRTSGRPTSPTSRAS